MIAVSVRPSTAAKVHIPTVDVRFLTIFRRVPFYHISIQYNGKGTAYDTLTAHPARHDTIRDDASEITHKS